MPVIASTWNTFAATTNTTTRTTTSAVLPAGAYLSLTMALTTSLAAGLVTITDSGGGTWTQIHSTTTTLTTRTFWRTTPGTGASITVTIVTAAAANCVMVGTYFTGASGIISGVPSATATTAYPNLTTPAANKSGDLYVANVHGTTGTTTTFTPGSGWTARGIATVATGSRSSFVETRLATSDGTTTAGVVTSSPTPTSTAMSAFVVYEAFRGWGLFL